MEQRRLISIAMNYINSATVPYASILLAVRT